MGLANSEMNVWAWWAYERSHWKFNLQGIPASVQMPLAPPAGIYWNRVNLCKHCHEWKGDHAGTKCLLLPTDFELFRGEGFR